MQGQDEDWNTYEREVLMMGYKVQHDFNNNWQFLQNARYMTSLPRLGLAQALPGPDLHPHPGARFARAKSRRQR